MKVFVVEVGEQGTPHFSLEEIFHNPLSAIFGLIHLYSNNRQKFGEKALNPDQFRAMFEKIALGYQSSASYCLISEPYQYRLRVVQVRE